MPTEEELRELAIKRLRKKKDLITHLVSYVIINAFLIAIWYFVAGRGYFWPGWVLLGWGDRARLQRLGRVRAARDHRKRDQAGDGAPARRSGNAGRVAASLRTLAESDQRQHGRSRRS